MSTVWLVTPCVCQFYRIIFTLPWKPLSPIWCEVCNGFRVRLGIVLTDWCTPGHIFQGRYKSLLIEDNGYLLEVVNYIHLNPVRAGVVELKDLRRYSLSSFPKFYERKRPSCLVNEAWLSLAGHLKPAAAGMRCYHQYLELSIEQDPAFWGLA